MRFVYLAQPIDLVSDSTQLDLLAQDVKYCLTKAGVGWYDPVGAWRVPAGQRVGREVRQVNLWAQGRCDGMVAILPDNIPSAGVPIEVERAMVQWDQPVAILGGTERWALPANGRRAYFGLDAPAAVEWLVDQQTPEIPRREPFSVKILSPAGKLPTKTHPDDTGYDLYVSERVTIPAGQFRDVPCGIAIQLPDTNWGMIVGRSSTLRKRGLLVQPGVIDTGWRGELFAAVQHLGGGPPTVIEAGDRIAQLLIFDNTSMRLGPPREVNQLETHTRGTSGFGSSGL